MATEVTDAARSRMASLVIALADDPGWISTDWIGHNVDGYTGIKRESVERYLRTDVAMLQDYGVPIQESGGRFRLDDAMWRLSDPEFSEEEAAVIAMAARVAFNSPDLAQFAKSGWGKLASVARRSDLRGSESTVVVADTVDLDGAHFELLLEAAQPPRRQVQFWYAKQHGADDELRTIEPWGIANLRGRYYLVGFDLDRKDVRTFRLTRVHDVVDTGTEAMYPREKGNLQDIVERTLSRGQSPVVGVVRVAPGRCLDLTRHAELLHDDVWKLPPVPEWQLVEHGLHYAGFLEVIEPVSVREAVVKRLQNIIAADAAGEDN
ncbi:helix-turn-helix transcriptional regulator [Corynebacterium sp. H113]|uniref:helix-turn-helix transcriptional regulator n=1 Tax=Corynebacterium sp. H113 TaxID=3133419 RepID=UPI0030A635E7